MNWWVTNVLNSPGGATLLAAWVIWVIVSITLHELAHGWAAISRGDMTPIHSGHMTWNPLVHMGGASLLVFALTGIAWGLMPIDPTRMRGRHAEAWVALAGPLMNVALALVCILGTVISILIVGFPKGSAAPGNGVAEGLDIFFRVGCSLNIALALFNLLPAPPLDGSRIVANFSRRYADLISSQGGQFLSVILFMVAFFFAGRIIFGIGLTVWAFSSGAILGVLSGLGITPPP